MSISGDPRIANIVREALGQPAAARSAFIRERCGDDDSLLRSALSALSREESMTLVDQTQVRPDSIEAMTIAPAGAGPAKPSEVRASLAVATAVAGIRRLGAYTIIDVLGEGGMGVVYRARQERPSRKVALKVLRAGMLTPRLQRRFELEAELLGRLDHPGIARIYEAGVAAMSVSGQAGREAVQPFFAMELVTGSPLTDFARARGLGLRERLELLRQVCDAVEHAHRKGVVHRDLKPGNILVALDARGQAGVKVLDFGVARVGQSEQDSARAAQHTEAGQLVGTVPYMSPEQVLGRLDEIDARSDVYALGVVMFELLSGRLPIEVLGLDLLESARAISQREPAALMIDGERAPGDLRAIAARALEKDRARRYQSASELSEDVRRYLEYEPVRARPPSRAYQLRKFVRRNRGPVAAVSGLVVVLLSGVVATTYQARQATLGRALAEEREARAVAAEARARDEAETAEQINRFITGLFGAINPEQAQGREPTIRDLVDGASRDIQGQFVDRPLVESAVRRTLGTTYRGLGRYDEGEAMLRRSLDLLERTLSADDQRRRDVERELVLLLSDWGRFEEAEKRATAALERVRGEGREHSVEGVGALLSVARVLQETGRGRDALPLLERAVEVSRLVMREDDPERVTALHNLGTALKDFGQLARGIPLLREALAQRERIHGLEHPFTLYTMNNLGAALHRDGKTEEAEALLTQTLERRERVLGPSHAATLTTMSNLAVVYTDTARRDLALPLQERAFAGWTTSLGESHPKTLTAMANLAYMYEDGGRLDDAERLFRKAVALQSASGNADAELLGTMNNLAMLLVKRGNLVEAERTYRTLLDLCEKTLPAEHLYLGIFRNNFGECLTLAGRFDEAQQELDISEALLKAKLPAGHARLKRADERRTLLGERRAGPNRER
jgi:serine/threonine protein kinase/Tfp pilus assembly protein PilF